MGLQIINCTASSERPGYPANAARDSSDSTFWSSGKVAPATLTFNLNRSTNSLILDWLPEMTPSNGTAKMGFEFIDEGGTVFESRYLTVFVQTRVWLHVLLQTESQKPFIAVAMTFFEIHTPGAPRDTDVAVNSLRVEERLSVENANYELRQTTDKPTD